jgi:phosphoribosylformylglycinamidine (FGAM) synthase PurS component
MKLRIIVTLKNGVLDPQGKAIQHALAGRKLLANTVIENYRIERA